MLIGDNIDDAHWWWWWWRLIDNCLTILSTFFFSDAGPAVDLIDPVSAYPVCVPPSPSPEDAALLVNLIPGVERFLVASGKSKRPTAASDDNDDQLLKQQSASPPASPVSSPASSRNKDAIDSIIEQFNQTTFTHPLKPHLKPVKVTAQAGTHWLAHWLATHCTNDYAVCWFSVYRWEF